MREITKEEIEEYMKGECRYKYYNFSYEEWSTIKKDSWIVKRCTELGKLDLLKETYENFDGCIKEGMPCTILFYTDRQGATIVEVEYFKSGMMKGKAKRIGVSRNVSKCIDYYAGDWEVTDELEKGVEYFTYRRNHTWVNEGGDTRDWGTQLAIGYRRTYEDPSF